MRADCTRRLRLAHIPIILCSLFSAASASEMWVELGPASPGSSGFTILARYAASTGESCPSISVDGTAQVMTRRALTGAFRALVCQATVPQGSKLASIRGEILPLPRWKTGGKLNIAVIGDTGCRIKKGGDDTAETNAKWNIQDCASPASWPFQEVATRAAAGTPDLVIHVGDYLYREQSCSGVANCPAGPAGDTLETWEADFFTPARKLLRAAPWVFVRGNHESCERAGDGWFSLLDPRDTAECRAFTDPYLVHAGKLPLAVVDDSTAIDTACAEADVRCTAQFAREVDTYAAQFRTITEWNLDHIWMLSHRPVWSVKKGGAGVQVLNAVLEASWARQRPQGVELLLAGHTHVFELIGFKPESGHAMQLVVGNSGTKLAPPMVYNARNSEVRQAQIHEFRKLQDFGWTTLRPKGDLWRAEAHDRTGTVRVRCTLPSREERCAQ